MDDGNTHSGIRARYTILDGDRVPFQERRSKTCAILDNEDCLEVCEGTELEPEVVLSKRDSDLNLTNYEEVEDYTEDLKKLYRKKCKRGHAHHVAREQQHRARSRKIPEGWGPKGDVGQADSGL